MSKEQDKIVHAAVANTIKKAKEEEARKQIEDQIRIYADVHGLNASELIDEYYDECDRIPGLGWYLIAALTIFLLVVAANKVQLFSSPNAPLIFNVQK